MSEWLEGDVWIGGEGEGEFGELLYVVDNREFVDGFSKVFY